MTDETISSLIDQLKTLQLQRSLILEKERDILLKLEETKIVQDKAQRPNERTEPTAVSSGHGTRTRTPRRFNVGDSVYITNTVRHARNPSFKHRAGVVTRVSGRRIYLETDSEHETWRIEANLRFLTEEEKTYRETY